MREDPKSLADRFFEKETMNNVDFEITFAAFLSTLVLTYPIVTYPILSQVTAFLLLGITLVRRIALSSPFAPRERVLSKTRPLIEVASTSAVICILASWSSTAGNLLQVSSSWVFVAFSVVGLSVLLGLQELVFRDYFAWWHVKFVERLEGTEYFQAFWLAFSAISLKFSRAEKYKPIRERVKEIRAESSEFPLPDQDFMEIIREEWFRLTFQILILALLFFGLPMAGGYLAFGPVGLFLSVSAVLIHDHSCFLYVAYGDPSYDEFRKPAWTIGFIMLVYVGELVLVLPSV